MKLKPAALVVGALLALLLIAPFLIPMESYLKKIEAAATQKLGTPVHIKSLSVALLPTPRAKLSGLTVGDGAITVNSISAVPDLATLLGKQKVLSLLEIDTPVIEQSALALFRGNGQGEAAVAVRKIVVHEATIEAAPLPKFDAEIDLAASNKLQKAQVSSVDGKLSIVAEPKGDGYAAKISANNWTSPAGPKLVFDTLSASLDYSGNTLDLTQLEATLYRGKLSASAKLDWEHDWLLSGTLRAEGVELGDATRIFTRAVKVGGRLSGEGGFKARAPEAGQLADRLALDFRFNIQNGVLHGMDLLKAASLLAHQGQTGGETRFDELSGELHSRGKQIELSRMQVSSGLLAAAGNVKISPDKKLSGLVDAELKKGVALVTVPLEISGTMDQPRVMPTRAAMAGAVAGTALLGPGFGTSLGIRAGKLFGR